LQYVFQNDAISDIHISQGSVATCLKRGGIFKHEFVANLLQGTLLKKFENRIIFGEVMAKSLVSCFLTHGVVVNLILETMCIAEHGPVLDIVDIIIIIIADKCKKLNSLKHLVRTTVAGSHN